MKKYEVDVTIIRIVDLSEVDPKDKSGPSFIMGNPQSDFEDGEVVDLADLELSTALYYPDGSEDAQQGVFAMKKEK